MAWMWVWILITNGCKLKLFHNAWKLCEIVIKKITLIHRRLILTHIIVQVPVRTAQWTYSNWLISLQYSNQMHTVNWLHIFFNKSLVHVSVCDKPSSGRTLDTCLTSGRNLYTCLTSGRTLYTCSTSGRTLYSCLKLSAFYKVVT